MEYDNSPPCSSRFFKNGVDATATAAVGSANSSASAAGLSREADDVDDAMTAVAVGSAISSSSALSREKEAAAGVAKMATIVARRRMNRLVVVFIVSCLLDYVMVMMRDRQSTTNDFFEFFCAVTRPELVSSDQDREHLI